MTTLPSIDGAVTKVQASAVKKHDRLKLVKAYLKGNADVTKLEGRALLHWRAEFVTRLRQRDVWP